MGKTEKVVIVVAYTRIIMKDVIEFSRNIVCPPYNYSVEIK
jgi:hypothetical protein